MIVLLLWACGQAPEAPVDAPPAPTTAVARPELPTIDDGFGAGCGAPNERACIGWAKRVRNSPEQYQALLGPSCERGHGPSCTLLADWLKKDEAAPAEQLERLYRAACTVEDGGGCYRLAEYVEGEERRSALVRGCTLGTYWACKQAGLPTPEER